ncbi:DUF1573 domain-containing protein [Pirellulaceae bacterium SH449]
MSDSLSVGVFSNRSIVNVKKRNLVACASVFIIVASFSLCIGYVFSGSCENSRRYLGGQRVFLTLENFDLGAVQKSSRLPIRFRVRNAGLSAIEIMGVQSTCGCLQLQNEMPMKIGALEDLEVQKHVKA